MATGIAKGKTRASGETAAAEEAKEAVENLTEPVPQPLPDEEKKTFRTPAFQRMRLDWNSSDRPIIREIQDAVEGRIVRNFGDAYQVMFEVYDLVRTPDVDDNGEVKKDQFGFPLWKRSVSGSYEEDWTKLTLKAKENLMFTLTTRIFEWSQRAADAWIEAMYAKAQFEERYAIGFDAPMAGTVDDRRAAGTKDSMEERYFALFVSAYSRKADAVVRSLELLAQRLKDSMVS